MIAMTLNTHEFLGASGGIIALTRRIENRKFIASHPALVVGLAAVV